MSEPSQNCTIAAMCSADSAPNSSESLVLLAWGFLVDVDDSLSEVVSGGVVVVDSFEVEDALVGVLLHLGSSETDELGSDPKPDLFGGWFAGNGLGFGRNWRHLIIMVGNNYDYLFNFSSNINLIFI